MKKRKVSSDINALVRTAPLKCKAKTAVKKARQHTHNTKHSKPTLVINSSSTLESMFDNE